jgi:osmotically-inducible protein OsmY
MRAAFWLLLILALAACGESGDVGTEPGAPAPDVAARGEAPDADDTGTNVRDRDEGATTPLDQSNEERDLEVTQQIRQQILEGDFSTDAENVKVITQQGVVTLRGPVESEAEKQAIVAIARDVAGAARVEDQLEVARD